MNLRKVLTILSLFIITFACKKDNEGTSTMDSGDEILTLQVPKGFPYPDIPQDNKPTPNRIALGEKLFFDPILSRDSTIACGSCHLPGMKFTDGLAVSNGIDGHHALRNAPTIMNVAYQPNFFWDGGSPTLEQQVLGPIQNPNEMDFNVNLVVARLQNNPTYVSDFKRAYNSNPSVFALTRAIACYERTLFTGRSKFDRYQYDGDTNALNASEKNGMTLFFNETGDCFHCHVDYNFTDYSFQNNGLYSVYADSGRARITLRASDVGKFKVPSLRNCELTAPYMHDGSMATLEEVVEHYNSGGQPSPTKSNVVRPRNMTAQEKTDLVNFLKALTDE
jgi:cytochrome c peroxidase